jgi:hypothetical protein
LRWQIQILGMGTIGRQAKRARRLARGLSFDIGSAGARQGLCGGGVVAALPIRCRLSRMGLGSRGEVSVGFGEEGGQPRSDSGGDSLRQALVDPPRCCPIALFRSGQAAINVDQFGGKFALADLVESPAGLIKPTLFKVDLSGEQAPFRRPLGALLLDSVQRGQRCFVLSATRLSGGQVITHLTNRIGIGAPTRSFQRLLV